MSDVADRKRLMRQAADVQRTMDMNDVRALARDLKERSERCDKGGRKEAANAYAKVAGMLEQLAKNMVRTQGRARSEQDTDEG